MKYLILSALLVCIGCNVETRHSYACSFDMDTDAGEPAHLDVTAMADTKAWAVAGIREIFPGAHHVSCEESK